MTRFLAGLAALLTLLTASPGRAQTIAPKYFTSTPDAVTGDNTPVSVNHPSANCGNGVGDRCYLPDSNPAAGTGWVDNYSLDIYERPMGQGSNAKSYLPWIDIVSSAVGFDNDYLYYRIELYGTEGGNLPSYYAFEINFDSDALGDILVRIEAPTSKVRTTWGTSGLIVFNDTDQRVGGPRPLAADGPSNTLGGYKDVVFDQGANKLNGAPGGDTAARARIDPTNPRIVELAVRRPFLVALNGRNPVTKASFRPYAAKGAVGQNQLLLHDEFTRGGSGSPYPWLRLAGAPNACPTSLAAENALTAAQRNALDSGSGTQTAFLNPCYPPSSIYELDNGGTAETLGSGGGLQFQIDMAVTKTANPNPAQRGRPLTYTVVARNLNTGAGQATNVKIVDTLPAGTTFLSAAPAQGACVHASGVVTCELGTVVNGASTAIPIVVRAPAALGPITNRVTIAANEPDPTPANNSFNLVTDVVVGQELAVSKISVAYFDGQNGATNPKLIPGGYVAYAVIVSNPHAIAVDADSIVVVDATPGSLSFVAADVNGAGSGPLVFEATAGSGLTFAYGGLANLTDDLDFSSDKGATWTYVPVANAAGVDPAVTHIRIRPKGALAATGQATFRFGYLIN